MVPINVHSYIDIHDVAIFEGPAMLKVRIIPEFAREKEFNSLVRDPVTEDVVDARTA